MMPDDYWKEARAHRKQARQKHREKEWRRENMSGYFSDDDWKTDDIGDYYAARGHIRAKISVAMVQAHYTVWDDSTGKSTKPTRVDDVRAAKRAVNDTLRMWGVE